MSNHLTLHNQSLAETYKKCYNEKHNKNAIEEYVMIKILMNKGSRPSGGGKH